MTTIDILPYDKDKCFDYNNNSSLIPLETLFKYSNIGFRIIPLGLDSKTPAIKSTNQIYDNSDYWSIESISQEQNKFRNIATTFGKVHTKDEDGEVLYLNGLDIDSDDILRILFDLLEELKSKTFITKTKKDWGYHVYWSSHKQNPPIGTSKCRPG
jgi:hypothetical protein